MDVVHEVLTPTGQGRGRRSVGRRLVCVAIAVVPAILAACGGGGAGGDGQPEPDAAVGVVRVEVDWPERTRLVPYAAAAVVCHLTAADGTSFAPLVLLPGSSSGSWSGVAVGPATISASARPSADGSGTSQASTAATVTVAANTTNRVTLAMASEIADFTISPGRAELAVGESMTLTATATNAAGNWILVPDEAQWSAIAGSPFVSLNNPRAQSNYAVTMVGAAAGQATVQCSFEEAPGVTRTATATFTITAPSPPDTTVASFSIEPAAVSLDVGQSVDLVATGHNAAGQAVPLPDQFQWTAPAGSQYVSLNNPRSRSSYTVTVVGWAPGQATVQASYDEQPYVPRTATATVTVSAVPGVGISVDPQTATVAPGFTQQFTATVTGTSTTAVIWSATGGQVDANGLYTAPGQVGTYQVTATSHADPSKSASAPVTVQANTTIGGDGAALTLIPAGTFTMGYGNSGHESPQRTIYLDAYRIQHHEVTNARYAAFLNGRQPTAGELAAWIDLSRNASLQRIAATAGQYTVTSGWADHPVLYVSWHGAVAYAGFYGLQLPSEAQWEKAARGSADARMYPWGQFYNRDYVNASGTTVVDIWQGTSPVGSFAGGVSPYGLFDVAGNVWEWCRDGYRYDWYSVMPPNNPVYQDDLAYRVIRGGAWTDRDQEAFRVSNRYNTTPEVRTYHLGFRCVAAP